MRTRWVLKRANASMQVAKDYGAKKEIPGLMVWKLLTYPLFLFLFFLPFVQILPPQVFD
jgi:hypothetical protein